MRFPVSKMQGGVILDDNIANILIDNGYVFCVDGNGGYARPTRRVIINNINYHFEYLHRLVILLNGETIPDGHIVDHIDNITTNCRRNNLQFLTPQQNGEKKKLQELKYITEMQGFYRIRINGKDIGTRKTIEAAKRLRMIAIMYLDKKSDLIKFSYDNPNNLSIDRLLLLDSITSNATSQSVINRLTKLK